MKLSLWKNIIISYASYFRLLKRTFLHSRHTQARLTPRRFVTMVIFCPALLLLQTCHWLGFLLDEILFPRYKQVHIRQPLFIMGVPRSGTTFLHRFLAADRHTFTTVTLWELILAPSVTQRKTILGLAALDRFFGAPVHRLICLLEQTAFGGLNAIHKISLSDPEEDYFFLVPIYACFLLILPFPFFDELGHLAFFDDQTPAPDRQRIMAFYKTCLQRHLYVRGTDKILLSKNVSFSPMAATLADTFPESRLIGTVRHPGRAVPSHISSMMTGAALFDNNTRGHAFRDQMIEVQRYAYTHLDEILSRLPENRHLTVKMEDLQTDLRQVITTIYQQFGYTMTKEFTWFLHRKNRQQRSYTSGHRYDLAAYDMTEKQILQRFADACHRFGYTLTSEAERRPSAVDARTG